MAQVWHIRDPAPGDLGWIIASHARHYVLGEGFAADFELVVARVLVQWAQARDPVRDRLWIAADAAGMPVGSILCAAELDDVRLRLFYVDPAARGRGVGGLLLGHLIAHARKVAARRIVLSTHAEHAAACRLYAAQGFDCLSSSPCQSFGRDLTVQHWSLPLS